MKQLINLILSAALLFISSCKKENAAMLSNKQGILLVGNTAEPESLDPQVATGVIESNIIRALFEGLCVEDPKKDGNSLPGVAESWTHTDDFKIWTFKLRSSNRWSDGKPLTTDDFLFSYERILSPKFAAKYAGLLYLIEGAEQFNKGETSDFSTVGVKAINPHTLEIRLKAPTPFLPELTKHYTWYPVPKHAVLRKGKIDEQHTNWTDLDNIVSNGPFQLKSWQFNYLIEVEKNQQYWDTNVVKLNGIKFLPVSNQYTENRMFAANQLHVTATIPAEMIEYSKAKFPKNIRQETYLSSNFLRCNVNGKLKDVRIRKAISLSLPRQVIVDNLLKGGQKPSTSLTPPFGDYKPPMISRKNLTEAKQLLADAGYPNGENFPEIDLLTTKRETSVKIAEAIANILKRDLGIIVNIKKYEWQTYLAELSSMNYDLGTGGWTGDYIDPTTFLDMWREGDGNNRTGWSSKEYENILDDAAQTADPKKRLSMLAQAEELMLKEYPIININWNTSNYLLRSEVKGWYPLLLNNHPYKFVELK